jgi:hypothetical protein
MCDLLPGLFGLRGFEDASSFSASTDRDLGFEHDGPIDRQGFAGADQLPDRQRNPVLFQYSFGFVFKQPHRILLIGMG